MMGDHSISGPITGRFQKLGFTEYMIKLSRKVPYVDLHGLYDDPAVVRFTDTLFAEFVCKDGDLGWCFWASNDDKARIAEITMYHRRHGVKSTFKRIDWAYYLDDVDDWIKSDNLQVVLPMD